jgi:hypothetical protein
MDPISNVDRLVILLRQKLIERSRKMARDKPGGKSTPVRADPSVIDTLAGTGNVDERVLHRAVIQNLLAEQFGADVINDAQFQSIISRVTEAIKENADTASLMGKVISSLRQS